MYEPLFEMIGLYKVNLSDKEIEICRQVAVTMWDFHWDVALYEEVVLRGLYDIEEEEGVFREQRNYSFLLMKRRCMKQ